MRIGATFRFYGETNYFLPTAQRNVDIFHAFDWKTSIKDMVEALGVPHPEIELMTVDRRAVDFEYILPTTGVYVEIFDRADPVELEPKIRLRPPLTEKPRFILDTHLGRLASYLRMMGFDTLYRNDYDDDELAYVSHHDHRVLLTRDIGLLKRSLVIYGRFMRETDPKRQIIEVLRHYQLSRYVVPLQRCLKCNGVLNPVEKAAILAQLTETTAQHFDVFHQCPDCGQIYWKGSHYEKMRQFMDEVITTETEN